MFSQAMVQRIEHKKLAELTPQPNNLHPHPPAQVAAIAASIAAFGFNAPILIDSAGSIIAGNGRYLAGRSLGLETVPVIVLDHLSETEKRAYLIADNKLAELSIFDDDLLRKELAELRDADIDFGALGFDEEELARLLGAEEATAGLTDEDSVPDVAVTPVTRSGELWTLGSHKLLIGDATKAADVARLMGSDRADLVFTDLPYNCAYEGYTDEHLTIQNDRMSDADFKQFLAAAFQCYRSIVKPGASLYVCHPSSWQREFQNAMEAAGFEIRYQIIWAKNTFAWGFGRYKFQHEPIFNAHVAGQTDAWYGDKSQSTLWQENKPAANRLHPTMKPVALAERALANSSKMGGLCADFFGGAGSTLIACERLGRKARLMELDRRYADVICRRYQEFVGKPATLDGDGRTFDQIAEQRQQQVPA